MSLLELIRKPSEVFDGKLGISVKDLDSGEVASLNGGELFPTASVFKVPVIVELYRQVDAGAISLDERIILMERDKVPGSGILRELGEKTQAYLRILAERGDWVSSKEIIVAMKELGFESFVSQSISGIRSGNTKSYRNWEKEPLDDREWHGDEWQNYYRVKPKYLSLLRKALEKM